jgi:hypothetical protein
MSGKEKQNSIAAEAPKLLHRFTSMPFLLHFLRTKKLTFLSPKKWVDRNDAYYLERYAELKGCENILAICFTSVSERYHHWQVFAPSTSGVRITFESSVLLKGLSRLPHLRAERVEYKQVTEVRRSELSIEQLPFTKRYPFRDEEEFRMILEDHDGKDSRDVPIKLDSVLEITLSPLLSPDLVGSIAAVIETIPGCGAINVKPTTLIDNETWKKAARNATAGKN